MCVDVQSDSYRLPLNARRRGAPERGKVWRPGKLERAKRQKTGKTERWRGERGGVPEGREREGEESRGGLGAFNGEFSQRSVLVQLPSLPGYQAFLQGWCWSQAGQAPMLRRGQRTALSLPVFPLEIDMWAACARNLARRAQSGRPPPEDETDATRRSAGLRTRVAKIPTCVSTNRMYLCGCAER